LITYPLILCTPPFAPDGAHCAGTLDSESPAITADVRQISPINVHPPSCSSLKVNQESLAKSGKQPIHVHLQLDVRIGLAPGETVQARAIGLNPGF
jgi:hypothetical protein